MRSTPLHTEAAGAAPPDAFGPFRVLHQIGAGALGPVFRAYDPDQDRLAAVKLFRLDLPPERVHQLVANLQRLIDVDLSHPALAAPLSTGIVGVAAYLAQDFVAADSLDTVIREFGPMSAADAARIAVQLAGALDVAAAAGVYHGALHPRDVLVAADDARLTGVGVAQSLESLGIAPSMRRPYAAPERIAGRPWDRRADVFSLAVLVAEMIAGRRVTGSGARLADGVPDSACSDMDALRGVFAKGAAEDPADRFDTAMEFADALKRAADQPGEAPAAVATPLRPHEQPLEARLPLDDGIVETRLPGDIPLERPLDDAEPDDIGWDLRSSRPPLAPDAGLPDMTLFASPAAEHPTEPVPAALSAQAESPVDNSGDLAVRGAPADVAAARLGPSLDAPQSAVWPITLALFMGLIVGVAVGFFIFAGRSGAAGTDPAAAEPASSATVPAANTGQASPVPPAGLPEPAPAAPPAADRQAPPAAASQAVRPAEAPASDRQPPPQARRETARDAEPRPAAPARAAAPAGRVLVRSSPQGARVLLDGKPAGSTPLTVRGLAIGSHTLRVMQDGYEPNEQRVQISAAQPAQSLIVDLVRVRPPAAGAEADGRFVAPLVVESRPPGAVVYLNGRRVGTTPLMLDAVASGSHALRLELEGYRRWTSSVRVSAGERNRVTASLEQ